MRNENRTIKDWLSKIRDANTELHSLVDLNIGSTLKNNITHETSKILQSLNYIESLLGFNQIIRDQLENQIKDLNKLRNSL